jgi:hypothetical protein
MLVQLDTDPVQAIQSLRPDGILTLAADNTGDLRHQVMAGTGPRLPRPDGY